MRVVDRKTFLALPAGTVYAKLALPNPKSDALNLSWHAISVKGDTLPPNDFVLQPVSKSWFTEASDTLEFIELFEQAIEGKAEPRLDYDCGSRDGLYDDDQKFMVWSREDVADLIALLSNALVDGYSAQPETKT